MLAPGNCLDVNEACLVIVPPVIPKDSLGYWFPVQSCPACDQEVNCDMTSAGSSLSGEPQYVKQTKLF